MASVTFDVDVGGDGSTVTDDSNATTGLAGGGHRVRFVPALTQLVNVSQNTVDKSVEAANTLVAANIASANAVAAQIAAEAAAAIATTGVAFPDTSVVVKGGTDATKQLRFEVDGFTSGTTRVLTAPNFDGTIATLAGTETLTNKTLTSPTINTPTIATPTISSAYFNGHVRSNSTAVAALDIVCTSGNYFTKTIAGNSTFTFSTVPAGVYSFTLEITHTSGTIVFPTSVTSSNDAAPVLTAGKTHLFFFVTRDGGTKWRMTYATNYTT